MLLIPLEHSGRRNGSVTASPSVFHHSSAPPGQLVGGTRRCSVTALPVHCPSAGSISPVSPSLPLPLSPDLAAGALEGRRPCPSLPSARGQAPVSRRAGCRGPLGPPPRLATALWPPPIRRTTLWGHIQTRGRGRAADAARKSARLIIIMAEATAITGIA